MQWLVLIGCAIIVGLGLYAWILTRKVKALKEPSGEVQKRALQAINILVDSYLDDQVDRSECVLRIRVLLDGYNPGWFKDLELRTFHDVSTIILSMPFGDARKKIDGSLRRDQDAARRQLLQFHEANLSQELKLLKEWADQ